MRGYLNKKMKNLIRDTRITTRDFAISGSCNQTRSGNLLSRKANGVAIFSYQYYAFFLL